MSEPVPTPDELAALDDYQLLELEARASDVYERCRRDLIANPDTPGLPAVVGEAAAFRMAITAEGMRRFRQLVADFDAILGSEDGE
jgi:hypothetical protein